MRIPKSCEYCKKEFIARKTTSKTCSDGCAKRLYKLNQRNDKIQQAICGNRNKRSSEVFNSENRFLHLKEYLTLKEAAFLLNISPLTLRRWIFTGKLVSIKNGKKHCIKRKDLLLGD